MPTVDSLRHTNKGTEYNKNHTELKPLWKEI